MNGQKDNLQKEPLKGILLPRCSICDKVPEEGIRGGFKIKKSFICKECELAIINMDITASNYGKLIEKIKNILK